MGSTIVYGDTIGTNRAGTMALRNVTNGVTINGSSNSVGTAGAIVQNLISGNGADGVYISGSSNKVYGSQIGTNQLGTAAIANATNGVEIVGNNNEVGSALNGGGNLISGNGNDGVLITTGNVNTVAGNRIGTNATGNAALPNASTGLDVSGDSNIIGVATDLGRNVISGNKYLGVNLSGSYNTVANNYIGLGKDGTTNVGNAKSGLVVQGVLNVIGGEGGPDTRNVISGNGGNGILIRLYGNNRVEGNYVGLSWIGTSKTDKGIDLNLGNSLDGIYIERSTGNTVGGTLLADRNYICGSTDFGVEMGVGATSNTVQNNAIGMCFDPNNLMGALIVAANLQGWKKDGPGTNTWTADNVHN